MLKPGDIVRVQCNFYEQATVVAVYEDSATVDNGGETITWSLDLLRKVG
jgi:hypothetical protein